MRLVMVNNTNKPIIFSRFAIDAREMVVVEQKLILSDVKVKNSQRSRSISLFVLSAPSIAGRLNKARLITISELDPARRFRKAVNSEKEVAEPVKTDPEPEKEVAEPVKTDPEPEKEVAEPVKTDPEPVKETPEPVKETPEPVKETPEPVKETPEPVKETIEPEKTDPEPEKEVEEQVKTDPEPEKEVAEPVKATKTAGAHPNSKKPAQATADASNKPKRVRSNSGKKAPQEIPGL